MDGDRRWGGKRSGVYGVYIRCHLDVNDLAEAGGLIAHKLLLAVDDGLGHIMNFLERVEGNEGDLVTVAVDLQVAVLARKQHIGVLGSRDVRNAITTEHKNSVRRSSITGLLQS